MAMTEHDDGELITVSGVLVAWCLFSLPDAVHQEWYRNQTAPACLGLPSRPTLNRGTRCSTWNGQPSSSAGS
jgi:hypothetical protein